MKQLNERQTDSAIFLLVRRLIHWAAEDSVYNMQQSLTEKLTIRIRLLQPQKRSLPDNSAHQGCWDPMPTASSQPEKPSPPLQLSVWTTYKHI